MYVIELNILLKFFKYVLRGLFDLIKVEFFEDYLLYRIDIMDKDKKF